MTKRAAPPFTIRDAVTAIKKNAGILPKREREFLGRLKSDEYEREIEILRLAIRKHRKIPNDLGLGALDVGRIIIKNAMTAFNVTTTYWRLPDEINEQKEKHATTRAALGELRCYFARYRSDDADQLRKSLDWAESVIDRGLMRFGGLDVGPEDTIITAQGELPQPLRLRRQHKTTAAQRATFQRAMSQTFLDFLGKRCDAAVAALTDIAFGSKDTPTEQVRRNRRPQRPSKTGPLTSKRI
jgi:hypothetical protein